MKASITVRAVRVIQDRGHGLRAYRAYRAYDQSGNPLGYPQSTAKLARAWGAS